MNEKSELEMAAAAERFIANCPEGAHIEVFNHDRAVGFVIQWSLPGMGFGEITIARHRTRGPVPNGVTAPDGGETPWTVDDEEIGPDTVARILPIAFPQGATTALDLQNLGCRVTVDQLLRAFDAIDVQGDASGRFGSEGMNTIVARYKAAKGPA